MESAEQGSKVTPLNRQLRKQNQNKISNGAITKLQAEALASKMSLQALPLEDTEGSVTKFLEFNDQLVSILIIKGDQSGKYEIIYIDKDVSSALGYSIDELTYRLQASDCFIHPDDLAHMLRDNKYQSHNEVSTQRYRLRHKDGSYYGIRGNLNTILYRNENIDNINSWICFLTIEEMINLGSKGTVQLLQGIAEATKCLQKHSDNLILALAKTISILGNLFDVDRVCVVKNSVPTESQELMINFNSGWKNQSSELTDIISYWNGLSYRHLDIMDWLATLTIGNHVIGSKFDLSPKALAYLPKDCIFSYLIIPLHVDKEFWGFLGLFCSQPKQVWSESEVSALSTISVSISSLLKQHQVEQELRHNALHDPLTHLPNRRLLLDRLQQLLEFSEQSEDYFFAVLFLDLDRFKIINDSLGHLIGDQLLVAIANRLLECIRPRDTVARLGGDEFSVLLADVKTPEDVTRIATRIQHQLSKPFYFEPHEVYISASIGISLSNTSYKQPEDFLRAADTAMYRAKKNGGSQHELYDAKMHTEIKKQLKIETDLRKALESEENEEIFVQYQPVLSLLTGKISGFEALVRWQHPEHGLISPAEFIPVAEELKLIIPIDLKVMRKACHQVKQWNQKFSIFPPLTLSVNLSALHFTELTLVSQIEDILDETHLEAHLLKVEITETAIIQNVDLASQLISQLKALQIGVYLDDFGIGYSCLSNLRHFAISALKIDRSFIRLIDSNGENYEIVRAIVILAHNLGMDVIAEGIEAQAHLNCLQFLRCEFGQGYLFSPPIGHEEVESLIKQQYLETKYTTACLPFG